MIRLFLSLWLGLWASSVVAQDLTGLARVDQSRSRLVDKAAHVVVELGLTQPVPYRVFTLDAPRRLVVDFSVVAWEGFDPDSFDQSRAISDVVAGNLRPNWSRMVLMLDAPLRLDAAELTTADPAALRLILSPTTPEAYAAAAGTPESAVFQLPQPEVVTAPRTRPSGTRAIKVVLDPGHGGIDPGAQRAGVNEKDIVLTFARELREVLLRAGGFDVTLTRSEDVFVPLEMRQAIARAAGADVFISLHADALAEGQARGATIYTLAPEATDAASEKLAERHNRVDLLAGVDLRQQDDVVALVLMDLVRTETIPRTDRLADALVDGLKTHIGRMYKRPRMKAAFSVLKSPDIPSVLIELGFMSSREDLANLRSPEWRARAAAGIRDALRVWATGDAAETELLRQ